jgi:DNA repair photolyase
MIYTPSGKAREYSPLALNLYTGCNFGCKYCYAPRIRRKTREDYNTVVQRKEIIKKVKKSAEKHKNSSEPVLLCFMHDPYLDMEIEEEITKKTLEIFLEKKIPVSILSKAGTKVLRDIDLFKKFGKSIQVGATLTFINPKDHIEWEPNSATPENRIYALQKLKKNGIRTWASFEPVIDINQSLELIKRTVDFVDVYKVGKLNNYKGIDKKINWSDFLSDVVNILRREDKRFYIKKDLREAAPDIRLYGNEVLMDEHNPEPFEEYKLF